MKQFLIFLTTLLPIYASKDVVDISFTCTIYVDDKASCTGTLISRMWVITTCLCVQHMPNSRVMIRVGDPYMHGSTKHVFYAAQKIETHPECVTTNNEYRPEHDISMIMLNEPFFDSKNVFIAKLPNQLMYWTPDTDQELELASYIDLHNKASNLKEAIWQTETLVVPPSLCEKELQTRSFKINKNTCANYWHKNGVNECKLDTGTPLVFEFIVVGILVHKNGCGKKDDVGSFVNVPMHSQWIRETCAKFTPWILL